MANIASQIKRNQRSLRERAENRQYTSAVKTYFRRLQAAVAEGDDERADAEHRRLIQLIDKAVKRGELARPVGADRVVHFEATALPGVGPVDIGVEVLQNRLDVTGVEGGIEVSDQPLHDRDNTQP